MVTCTVQWPWCHRFDAPRVSASVDLRSAESWGGRECDRRQEMTCLKTPKKLQLLKYSHYGNKMNETMWVNKGKGPGTSQESMLTVAWQTFHALMAVKTCIYAGLTLTAERKRSRSASSDPLLSGYGTFSRPVRSLSLLAPIRRHEECLVLFDE